MIPIRDDNPRLLTPYVTYGMISLNVLVWLFVQGAGTAPRLSESICLYGAMPGELLQTIPAGTSAPLTTKTLCVTGPDAVWSTLATYMFLHGSWFHLLGNMFFLWFFGRSVEDSMGPARFAAFYLLCGLIAAACQILAAPDSLSPIIGASGATAALTSAYIVLYPRVNVHMLVFLGFYITTFAIPALWILAYWLLLQFFAGMGAVSGEAEQPALWAHFGGFAAGLLLIPIFRNQQLLARHPFHGWARQELPSESWQRVER